MQTKSQENFMGFGRLQSLPSDDRLHQGLGILMTQSFCPMSFIFDGKVTLLINHTVNAGVVLPIKNSYGGTVILGNAMNHNEAH